MSTNGSLKTWHKLAAVLIVALAAIYALLWWRGGAPSKVTRPVAAGSGENAVEQLTRELNLRHQEHQQRLQKLGRANAIAAWFYPHGTDSNQVQKEIETLAFKTGLNYSILRSIATPGEKNDFVRIEEVNISGTVEIKSLIEFLREVESHKPLLRWSSCTLSPRQQQNAQNTVFVTGRIRAYVLSEKAAAILAGNPEP